MLLLILACSEPEAGPVMGEASVDVDPEAPTVTLPIPAGAVWTVECCIPEGCVQPQRWSRIAGEGIEADCGGAEWAEAVWISAK